MMSAQTLLSAEKVSKTYWSQTETVRPLQAIDLAISEGDFILIYGPSGSGKTTLLNVLSGIDSIESGRILYRGARIDDAGDDERTRLRRDHLGVIFQSFELIRVMTCRENIEYPLILRGLSAADRRSRVDRVAEILGIGELLSRKPEFISGGQKQRVAIARALVVGHDCILGDEITGSLDPRTAGTVYTLLAELNRTEGRTFLLVTHNRDFEAFANRIFNLEDGVLKEHRR